MSWTLTVLFTYRMEDEEEMEVREGVMAEEVLNNWVEGFMDELMEDNIEQEIEEVMEEEEEEDDKTEDEEEEEKIVEMRRWWRSVRASGAPIRITTVRKLRFFDLFDNIEEGDEAEEEEEEEWEELKVEEDEEEEEEWKDLEVEEADVKGEVENREDLEEKIEDVEEISLDENIITESPRRPSGLGVIEAWASEESLQPRRRWWRPKFLSRGSSCRRFLRFFFCCCAPKTME
ncbi:uncharacterized protein [Engystomops pustulosus]|uniref:uncharacterized protein isoform X3 n=1 Tax=Engystomops pustulosus TaxID=76066 RepID=UPI003AFB2CAD